MLTEQNIEAELSYAYLHAVASRAGFSCEYSNRHSDSAGVDATVKEDGRRLSPNSVQTTFDLHVQLKATYQVPSLIDGRFSFSLPVPSYNKLRTPHITHFRILVVMFLPQDPEEWLRHTEDGLIAKRCAYWVSLRNAAESLNPKHQTVYIPQSQQLSPDSLTALMTRLSRREEISYDA